MDLNSIEDHHKYLEDRFGHSNNPYIKKPIERLKDDPGVKARIMRHTKWLKQPKTDKYWRLRKRLVEAVKSGNKRTVSKIIKDGADVIPWLLQPPGFLGPIENDMPYTFLGLAASLGHHNLIDCLLKAGVDINDPGGSNTTPLHTAIDDKHVEFVKKIIQEGADIEAKMFDYGALTPLHLAVHSGNIECIKLLIQKGAPLDAKDAAEYTPLHKAAQQNHLSAIEVLLEAGCDRDSLMSNGGTALHVAAMHGQQEATELLIKRHFDINLKDENGQTPMEVAEIGGHASLVYWFAKREGKYQKYDTESLDSNEPLQSSVQLVKLKHSVSYYDQENKPLFNWVDLNSEENSSWKTLESRIPEFNSGYYQDVNGLTVLHVASKNGVFGGVKLLIEELKLYPHLKTYNNDTPADLAEIEGHNKIAKYLKKTFNDKSLAPVTQHELYTKLLTLISISDNFQEASKLLSQGAYFESYGGTRSSALVMAIFWDRVKIIELLLAAGAPLTAKHHGKSLLQVAWLSPDVSIRVKTIIGRAYYNKLMWEGEMKIKPVDTSGKKYLYAGLNEIMDNIRGKTPWNARWTIKNYLHLLDLENAEFSLSLLSKDVFYLSLVMGIAAKHNCILLTFFMNQVGAHPNIRTEVGLTPLHEALDAQFYELATVMVKHLDASLYIPDSRGRFPKDLMPTHIKDQLEQEQAVAEFHRLEESVLSARSETEKAEIKEIALGFVCLYATYTSKWDNDLCKWQNLHRFLISLIQVKNKKQMLECKSNDNVRSIQNEHYIWVASLCQNINKLNNISCIQKEEADIGFLDLLSCIGDLSNSIRMNGTNILAENSDDIPKSVSLLKSAKLATENKYRLYLHLLFTIGEQSIHIPLNDMICSLPLHHAAAAGNFSAVLYLTQFCKASIIVSDRNKNTPVHLAYMSGYKYIGDYLCKYDHNVDSIENSSGQTPKMLRAAFKEYEKLYSAVEDEDVNDTSLNLTEQINGLSLSTKLLKHWINNNKSMSFRDIMEHFVVDYSYGEAKSVLNFVIDFAKSIGRKIGEYNPLLKGTLVPVGSAGDNVRLHAPDENDCTWILEWKNVNVHLEDMSKEDQNLKNYKHSIRAESDDRVIQHLLEGTNLLEEFYYQSVKAVSELLPHLDPRLSLILPGVKRIGCGVCITLAWAGITYPMLIVNMDLVPAFRASRPANFIHPPLTNSLEDPRLDYIYVVQTHIQAGEKRCATTLEEQVIMQQLSSGQRLVFIIAKLLVSKLKTEKWASRVFKDRFTFFNTKEFKLPAPTGFLLKSAFFQQLEAVPDPECWKDNCIVERLKGIFHSMCTQRDDNSKLVSGLVPSYFSSTTQPPAAGFMAPTIYNFLVDNEELLCKMEESSSEIISNKELERLAVMWDEALNKYYYIP